MKTLKRKLLYAIKTVASFLGGGLFALLLLAFLLTFLFALNAVSKIGN